MREGEIMLFTKNNLNKKELIHSMQLENKEDRQIKTISQPRGAELRSTAGRLF